MADEQTQHSDQIDEVIRDAERQLEAKLEALRMSALGDPQPLTDHSDAELRPTGSTPAWEGGETWQAGETGQHAEDDARDEGGWLEPAAPSRWDEPETEWSEPATEPSYVEPAASGADGWSDAVIQPTETEPPVQMTDYTNVMSVPAASSSVVEDLVEEYEPYEPTEPSVWAPPAPSPTPAMTSAPDESELQFWAQTRTSLRHLQDSAETLPRHVAGAVTGQFEQVVRDELAAPTATLRQLQQQMPGMADHLTRMVAEELESTNATVKQMQEEFPLQLERLERTLSTIMHDELPSQFGRIERSIGTSVREDLPAQLQKIEQALNGQMTEATNRFEQSVATNVTRMAQGVEERVEHAETAFTERFEHVEQQMRSHLDDVERSLRDEFVAPVESIRQIQEELPAQFGRLERVVREQQAEMGEITSLTRGGLEKITAFGAELDKDRLQRVEDLELMIDAMTKGWQGLYAAMQQLFDRSGSIESRLQVLDRKLEGIKDLERTVDDALVEVRTQLETHLSAMQRHIHDLAPAPVVVTVNHPEAQVSQQTRGGFISSGSLPPAAEKAAEEESPAVTSY